jgi:hypothetical protein
MTKYSIVIVYHGPYGDKRVEEMTREELLAAVYELIEERDSAREHIQSTLRMMDVFRHAKCS